MKNKNKNKSFDWTDWIVKVSDTEFIAGVAVYTVLFIVVITLPWWAPLVR